MEDNNNSNNLDPEIRDLLHFHKKGTEYIKQALSIDENSSQQIIFFNKTCIINIFSFNLQVNFFHLLIKDRKEDAINYYKLGIEEFMLGLNVKIDQNNARGISIQEKMESNLTMAIERVEELSKNT